MTNMWREIQPADEYRVQLNGLLHDSDRSLLQLLYQPLVGAPSISFYSMLWEEVQKNQLESIPSTHATLLGMLSASIEELFEARIHLEGMGLLKTYIKGGDSREFLYQLQPPLQAKDFFEDPMLSVFLYRQVGSSQFQKLKKKFCVPFEELTSYREVTRSFQDVYASEALLKQMPDLDLAQKENETLLYKSANQGIETDFATFDFHLLLAGLSEMMVPRKAMTYSVKSMTAKLAALYGLNEIEMKSVIMSAVNEESEIEMDALRKAARDYYQLHRSEILPKLQSVRRKPETAKTPEAGGDEAELIRYLEEASPVQVLKDASNGIEPSKSELTLIEELLIQKKLPSGVVNVLLQFVLLRTGMKLTKGFVEQIANHWSRSNIQTVEAAMGLAKKEYKTYMEWKEETKNGTRKRKSNKTIRREQLPDWFKEGQKSADEANPGSDRPKERADNDFEEKKRAYLEKRRQKKLEAGEN
ncbi:replication initiation and membrane attachment family protein [Jeotgalibacillus proteolyticus]|uniref:Replication initiation and membrane attachment protein n=1 Tax=Jeotgalibacillus proteolyticus TaxID=2082395 RepID=A0A2S5GFF3_9BACL|nr:DnaD domain protein [Jeotgalibacillus proteolyticus]PPA71603.1 Replication initiation and membrane attachment protein [Jeotgalibacillus proteolyticus]